MQKDAGFSFVELMTVIAILAILAGIAIPSFISWRGNSQLSRASRDVYSILQKAKMEAIRRNENCAVTFNANEYFIWIDSAGDFSYDGGEVVVSRVSWLNYPGVSLDNTTFDDPVDSIAFAPDGLPKKNGDVLGSGEITISYKGDRKKTIEVLVAGSIRIK